MPAGLVDDPPGLTFAEPAYALALDWLLCDGLDRLSCPGGDSLYLRLTTRPIDQSPFEAALQRMGEEALREGVLAGGYRLVEPPEALVQAPGTPAVRLVASGAVMPEVVQAAGLLADEGVAATVVDVTSADRLYRSWRAGLRAAAASARAPDPMGQTAFGRLMGDPLHAPVVTVHDAASHALVWVGAAAGVVTVPIGFDEFGQSGSIPEVYGSLGFLPDQIVTAALMATAEAR